MTLAALQTDGVQAAAMQGLTRVDGILTTAPSIHVWKSRSLARSRICTRWVHKRLTDGQVCLGCGRNRNQVELDREPRGQS